jgi:methylenetetrahydrofolate reductase (NADPH)
MSAAVNAPLVNLSPSPNLMADPLKDFYRKLTVEITGRQADKVPLLAQRLAKGTQVFIALIDPADMDGQLQASIALHEAGLSPVPHVPARFVRDRADLEARLAALASKAGVKTMLVLGGGAPQPIGKYDAAIQLLETELFQKYGVTRIGIAGHPEGNPDITKIHGEPALMAALRVKQAWLKANGIDGFIATQFLFEAAPVAYWANQLREAGIELPIHVGVPGPATIKTLVKYAAVCGVGNSARFIRKQALNVTKLLTVNTPDAFVEQLAKLHHEKPELKVAGPHFYPFGGFDKLFDWLSPKLT